MSYVVYCHTNRLNGKRYVGFTPKNPEVANGVGEDAGAHVKRLLDERWLGHCRTARAGSDLVFHRAIRKHSESAFDHEVLEVCATLEDALAREICWIAELHTTIDEHGYNMTKGGEGNLMTEASKAKHKKATSEGTKKAFLDPGVRARHKAAMTEAFNRPEVIAKRRASQLIAQGTAEARVKKSLSALALWTEGGALRRKRCKRVQQLAVATGEVIRTFVSAHEAARVLGLSQGSISNVARGLTKTAGGFCWRYA